MSARPLFLGGARPIDGTGASARFTVPTRDLTTHGVIVGMTGSGKTGLVMVLVEEALRSRVPVLVIDVKGDLANLAYAFPSFEPGAFLPHLDDATAAHAGATREQRVERVRQHASLETLLADLADPPIDHIGALPFDEFLTKSDRRALANALNTLLAAPSFEAWRRGVALDVGAWLTPGADGRTPAVVLSVAHLDDTERALVLGLLFDELLAWVRTLSGTPDLRALVVFDEVYGFLPPHPANPPAKRPLLALLKQARAFGVGVVLATQNPMDLDYRALSNAGLWWIGRLQTDADRARVVEGLAGLDGGGVTDVDAADLRATLKQLAPRWFVVRDVHRPAPLALMQTRWTLSWMRGPMTRHELRAATAAAVPAANAAVARAATDTCAPTDDPG